VDQSLEGMVIPLRQKGFKATKCLSPSRGRSTRTLAIAGTLGCAPESAGVPIRWATNSNKLPWSGVHPLFRDGPHPCGTAL
jgi:hypothetical protein